MIGKTFGRLTVMSKAPKTDKYIRWICNCSCGNSKVVISSSLRKGETRSCGCLRKELLTKHGDTGTRLYKTWKDMRQRCSNKNNKDYPNYGGRGITYSPNWDDFNVFKQWAMSSGYNDTLTIERVDVDKGYSEDNCIWADLSTQQANKRKKANCSSKYIGVHIRNNGKWQADIKVKHKRYYLGTFDTELEAAQYRDEYIKTHNLPHKLNF